MAFVQNSTWRRSLNGTRMLLVLLVAVLTFPDTVQADEDATRDRRHRQILEKRQIVLDGLQKDVASVQAWCQEHQRPEAATIVQQFGESLRSTSADAEPSVMVTPPVGKNLAIEEQQWQLQLQHHREERAKELYTLARSSLRAGFPSLAFMMIGDVVRVDPDHKYARSVLGQQLFVDPARKEESGYAGEWVSPFEKQMRSGSKPQILNAQYGWIPAGNVVRYGEGLRPWKGDWISVDKESELRRDFRNAWEIPSEHFLVKTNVSLESGIELSQNLELFHRWLEQNFAAFFDTPQALQDRFEHASQRTSGHKEKPMEVHYYATREEYQKQVRGKVPPTVETNGLYWQPDRTSYFFANPDRKDFSTLYHEATHQILDVTTADDRRTAARARAVKSKQKRATDWVLCEDSNFWIIEGLACYFESFEVVDGNVSVGRPDYVRFDTARQRMLDPAFLFFMPTQQFFALGKNDFQGHPQVSPLYTQASGFAHFLMHYEDGLYRDDLIALLAAIYRPDPTRILEQPSLTKIAGVSFDDFDHQYRTHMQNISDVIEAKAEAP